MHWQSPHRKETSKQMLLMLEGIIYILINSNKVVNLILSDEHYTIDRRKKVLAIGCKIKNISYEWKIILLHDKEER